LILLRSLLFTAVFYVGSAAASIAMLPLLLGPRRWMIGAFRVWAKGVIWALEAICDIRLEVRGREHIPTGSTLLAPKHQCLFDTIAPLALMPDCCLVMKKELVKIPFYGWYALKSGMVVVDREGAAKTMRKLLTDGRDRLAQGRQLLIFPEGHRMAPGAAPDYKPGVAALYGLGVACTPVATNSGVHWPAHGVLRYPGTIVLEFLAPIAPGLKRPAFMHELEHRVETASNALLAEGV
jgi:1-acyl-sn-glycerol-3-phosphate acyltransferase